ncbi:conserved hypothetical protein [Histoplasma capsulatum G186AR]|uniref:Uncharacterized protein n=1 Tax=Ajellomyces capsulatus (strain G186AR / H82 / ATCC MYA-2454 / RMSCC 2432) TaxID=447093 RepID=C0NVX8_AJECG|nr:uncharacterized protein HCBG_07308 [Histoplasma capsulatum G186AR]EEH04667.1 conserved hypothetical protein [Histoplasma capsulatum G186AR]
MSDVPPCLSLKLGARCNLDIVVSKPVLSASTDMMSEQKESKPAPTKKIARDIHVRNQRRDYDEGDEDQGSINCSSVGLLRSVFGSRSGSKKRMTGRTGNQGTSLYSLSHFPRATISGEATNAPVRHLSCGYCSKNPGYLLFRGGEDWNQLELSCHSLHLDLFWPVVTEGMKIEKEGNKERMKDQMNEKNRTKDNGNERRKEKVDGEMVNPFGDEYEIVASNDDDDGILPLEAMGPLCSFRKLRFLRLTGMSQSYQKYIWQVAWLNPGLETLELEMMLEPCIRRAFSSWPYIKGGWIQRSKPEAERSSYYGDEGQGILHRRAGIGEYLDKYSIVHAKARAAQMGSTLHLLPVVKLSLTGFVVDADPFHLFNPHRLRLINFKNNCVDAGFALPERMREQVVVSWPKILSEQAIVAKRVNYGEIKRVDCGSKVKKVADNKQANCSAATAKATTMAKVSNIGAGAESGKSMAVVLHKEASIATPNFSYPNPRAPVASPKCAARHTAAAEYTGKGKIKQRDGNKLCNKDLGEQVKKDRMRLFSSWKKAKS